MTVHSFNEHEQAFRDSKPHYIPILDWFVLSGAMTDEKKFETEQLGQVLHHDIEFYFGPALCDDALHIAIYKDERYFLPDHVVEVAGLAVLNSPLPTEALESLIEPFEFRPPCDGHDALVEVIDDESGRSVWVVRRFTEEELAAPEFDAQMREFVALTLEVQKAVLS